MTTAETDAGPNPQPDPSDYVPLPLYVDDLSLTPIEMRVYVALVCAAYRETDTALFDRLKARGVRARKVEKALEKLEGMHLIGWREGTYEVLDLPEWQDDEGERA